MKRIPHPVIVCLFAVLLLVRGGSASAQQVYISEFLADNQLNSKVDEDGDHSDWMEIWNATAATVSLNGWYLTDESGDLRKWRFPVTTPAVTLSPGARLVVFASSKNRKLAITKLHTNFRLGKSAGGYLALVQPDGLTIEHAYTNYPQQVQDIAYGLVLATQLQTLLPEGAAGRAKVPTSAVDMPTTAPAWNSVAFDDSAWQAGQTGFGYDTAGLYGALIGPGGDLQAAMYNVNSSALVRIPFNVTDPAAIVSLRLSMKYDDGFNCYLNGQLIQQSFSGGTAYNSQAILDRNGSQTATYQVFTPSTAHQYLVAGTNVLAIQILNYSNGSTQDTDDQGVANGSRTLALPVLEGNFSLGVGSGAYLASATAGAANSGALTALGPSISGTTNKPPRPVGGAGSAPIVITTKVVPSLKPLHPTTPVQLRYRVMYGAESNIVMQDNGVAPDTLAGDSIYSAQIPTTALQPGQMIRWRVIATDNASANLTDPPYRDTNDNEQYYGTVALDNITTSQLPLMHWFVADAAASRTEAGTKCSLFFLGDFYDNVRVNLHGQSSAGFPVNKKSHDFNFNEDNRFKWKEGEARQRGLNLITNYADKTKVRNTMAWESWQSARHIASHWVQPVRVQQNAAYWGVYDMVENGDEDFLERTGLDPTASLYKIYDRMISAAPGVSEKKSGFPATDFSDLADLYVKTEYEGGTALPIATRRLYGYDNVDIPSLVNALAVDAIIINNDQGHKNFYLYRDTNGSREWSLLPWDQDLSYGHTWVGGPSYFDDEIDSRRGLRLGSLNKIKSLAYDSPEINAMFVRRVRSLIDQWLVSAAATDGPLEQRINQLISIIDPNNNSAATGVDDADLDIRTWGFWEHGTGGTSIPYTDSRMPIHTMRMQAARLLNSNPNNNSLSYSTSPVAYPGVSSGSPLGSDTRSPFFVGRRSFLYSGSAVSGSLAVPAAQAATPTGLVIEHVDANPSSGNQEQEFFIIRNNSSSWVDISGWKITGAVNYTFRGGTVIPPFSGSGAVTATGDVHTGRLHVTRNPYQFRQRTVSPKGGEYRLAIGGYSGFLSARGETINLVKPGAMPAQDVVIATTAYAAAPTASQNYLRVTELNFNPTAPTPAELTALPGVQGRDFEFVELMNTGPSALNLGNAAFTEGIDFIFPAGFILQPGQRCVIVALTAAYNLRYAGAGAIVAGQFEGNLDNNGETLQLRDSVGESVLEFTYDPLWFGIPQSSNPALINPPVGYSLVTRTNNPAWNAYGNPTTWALSDASGGSPGTGDAAFANAFIGWRKDFFTAAEEANPALSDPSADADLDGRTNFEEYLFGGNPRAFENPQLPTASLVNVSGTDYLAITFTRRHNAIDTTYIVEYSGSLGAWTPVNLPVGTPTDLGNGLERVTYRDLAPFDQGPRYLRVRAVR